MSEHDAIHYVNGSYGRMLLLFYVAVAACLLAIFATSLDRDAQASSPRSPAVPASTAHTQAHVKAHVGARVKVKTHQAGPALSPSSQIRSLPETLAIAVGSAH